MKWRDPVNVERMETRSLPPESMLEAELHYIWQLKSRAEAWKNLYIHLDKEKT